MPEFKLTTSRRIAIGFTGVLFVAGTMLYLAKKSINDRRKAEFKQEYRSSGAHVAPAIPADSPKSE